jgi:sec-independent protein translocase protein TatA
MQFVGISPVELIFIVVILFLVLGPQDLVKLGSTLGRTIRSVRQSSAWQSFNDATRQLRELPENLARQAGVDELEQLGREIGSELKDQRAKLQELDRQFSAWTREPEPLSQKKKQPPQEGDQQ